MDIETTTSKLLLSRINSASIRRYIEKEQAVLVYKFTEVDVRNVDELIQKFGPATAYKHDYQELHDAVHGAVKLEKSGLATGEAIGKFDAVTSKKYLRALRLALNMIDQHISEECESLPLGSNVPEAGAEPEEGGEPEEEDESKEETSYILEHEDGTN